MRRSSVNQKINALLEESVRERFEADMDSVTGPRAERILARGSLYGIGGGGDLPRVKKGGAGSSKEASKAEMSAASITNRASMSPSATSRVGLDMSQSLDSMSSLGQSFPFYNADSYQPQASVETLQQKIEKRSLSRYAHDGMYSVVTFRDPNKVSLPMLHQGCPRVRLLSCRSTFVRGLCDDISLSSE